MLNLLSIGIDSRLGSTQIHPKLIENSANEVYRQELYGFGYFEIDADNHGDSKGFENG